MALTEKLTAIADAIRERSGKTDKLTLSRMPAEILDLQALNFEVVGNPQPENPKENTIWVNTDTEITSWYFGANEPVGKNLLPNTASTQTVNGVTFTVNADGSIILNGTATQDGYITLNANVPLKSGIEYIASSGVARSDAYVWILAKSGAANILVNGQVTTNIGLQTGTRAFSMTDDLGVNVRLYVANGATFSNVTFYPMLRKASIADATYEPYGIKDGTVWIQTGITSPVTFNALKKNGISVCPLSAKQYTGGAWVEKAVKTYQSDEWKGWVTWLYKDGNQYTDVTGGWNKTVQNGMDIAFGDAVSFTYKSTSNIGAYFNSAQKIDITGKSWLRAQGLITGGYDAVRFIEIALCKELPSNFVYSADSSAKLTVWNVETQIDVDLRSLSGEYYIVVSGGGVTGTVGDIRLE